MATLRDLDTTIAVAWYDGFSHRKGQAANHWETKTSYYEAARRALKAHPDEPLTYREIFAEFAGEPKKSTFYQAVGNNAKNPLVDWYGASGEHGASIAATYRPADRGRRPPVHQPPVHRLVDETKAWSYWQSRPGWLQTLGEVSRGRDVGRDTMVRTLLRILAEWAVREPFLAAALDFGPPICAVEDLLVIRNWDRSASEVKAVLADLVRGSLSVGAVNDFVLSGALAELAGDAAPFGDGSGDGRAVTAPLAKAIMNVQDAAPGLPNEIRMRALAMLRDAVDVLAAMTDEESEARGA